MPPSTVNRDRFGFLQWTPLPNEAWKENWSRIYVDPAVKHRLLRFVQLMLFRRSGIDRIGLPLSGVALLSGPPGTGKTSLVRGLAHQLAADVGAERRLVFAEVDGHALPSQMLGESQRNVAHLLEESIPELASQADGMIVLIDEIDGFAVNRGNAATGSDPVDVVRATEAVLRGIDRLAATDLPVAIIGTTNFPQLLDEAFLDRVDLVERLPLPDADTATTILRDSLEAMSNGGYEPDVEGLERLGGQLVGLSGREIRHLVFLTLLSREDADDARVPSVPELTTAVQRLRRPPVS